MCSTRADSQVTSVRSPPVDTGEARIVFGTIASRGVVIGVLHLLENASGTMRNAGSISAEREALDSAIACSLTQLRALSEGSDELGTDVIGFQLSLLQDEEFLTPVRAAIESGSPVDVAWKSHLQREIADYESAQSAYLRDRSADLRDLRDRLMMSLVGVARSDRLPQDSIVIVEELTPSRFLELDWDCVAGVATFAGSFASHAAMLARARGVPMLVQLACDASVLVEGAQAVIDAEQGRLVLEPMAAILEDYGRRIEARYASEREALQNVSRPAHTRAGTAMQVLVNIDDPSLLESTDPSHCDGIGPHPNRVPVSRRRGVAGRGHAVSPLPAVARVGTGVSRHHSHSRRGW